MPKFKVGDRVMCAELGNTGGTFYVPSGEGVVTVYDPDDSTYIVLRDEKYENRFLNRFQDKWWYSADLLTAIPTPSARITTIEWFTPDECLPYEGADVYFVADDGHYAGKFYGNKNLFSVSLCYGNGDGVEFHDNEVLFWAYAPEVK